MLNPLSTHRIDRLDRERDLEAYLRLRHRALDQSMSTAEFLEVEARRSPDRPARQLVIRDGDQVVAAGQGTMHHDSPTKVVMAWVAVEDSHQRRGLGRAILQTIEGYAREVGGRKLMVEYPEAESGSARFAEALGFAPENLSFESSLDLTTLPGDSGERGLEILRNQGLELQVLRPGSPEDPELGPLYGLFHEAQLDEPMTAIYGVDPESLFRSRFSDSAFQRGAAFIATDGEQFAGYTQILWTEGGDLWNEFTGTARAYRGRGLAYAVKLLATDWARQQGGTILRTYNHSTNAPMLAVNRKLGYRPKPAWVTAAKELL